MSLAALGLKIDLGNNLGIATGHSASVIDRGGNSVEKYMDAPAPEKNPWLVGG